MGQRRSKITLSGEQRDCQGKKRKNQTAGELSCARTLCRLVSTIPLNPIGASWTAQTLHPRGQNHNESKGKVRCSRGCFLPYPTTIHLLQIRSPCHHGSAKTQVVLAMLYRRLLNALSTLSTLVDDDMMRWPEENVFVCPQRIT